MKAIIFVAHGSKKAQSNEEFISLIGDVSQLDQNYAHKEAAFLEFAKPTVETCVEQLITKQVTQIDIYPYFLNSGKHVAVDLPNLLESFKKNYPKITFRLLKHFGQSNQIAKIILSDISTHNQNS